MDLYLQQLTSNVLETFARAGNVHLTLEVSNVSMDVAQAMPCGLIVNELFTNILKHAFPPFLECQPEIYISLQMEPDSFSLVVKDNGVGLPHGFDWQNTRSQGLRLVNLWVTHQLGGTLQIVPQSGTAFKINFPFIEAK
jgi:two-component sensor histidine kinase